MLIAEEQIRAVRLSGTRAILQKQIQITFYRTPVSGIKVEDFFISIENLGVECILRCGGM